MKWFEPNPTYEVKLSEDSTQPASRRVHVRRAGGRHRREAVTDPIIGHVFRKAIAAHETYRADLARMGDTENGDLGISRD
jgi:hypothetical protein